MRLSFEQCDRILERLGYYPPVPDKFERPRPDDAGGAHTYLSGGEVAGPKGIALMLGKDATLDRGEFRAYLLSLGIDGEAVAEVFDALD